MSEEDNDWKPEKINQEQIDYAWDLIAEFHPLQHTPIHIAYPYLKYLCPCSPCTNEPVTKGEQDSVQEPLLEHRGPIITTKNGKEIELKIKPRKKKSNMSDAEKADPINMLGFGIVAYRDLLYNLIWVFAVLTILMMPTLAIYRQGNGYQQSSSPGQAINSLGNLGYSSVECATTPIGVEVIAIQCPYGTVGEIYDYGVQPPINNLPQQICQVTSSNSICKPNDPAFVASLNQAVGSNITIVEFDKNDLWTVAPADTSCDSQISSLFVQYSCVQSPEEQNMKFQAMTIAVSSGVFVCLIFNWFVIGFYNKQKLNQLQWDMSTVTVADYAVEFPIPPEKFAQWYLEDFCKEGGDRDNGVPIGIALKTQLKEKVEKFLTDDRMQQAGITPHQSGARSRVLRRLNQIDDVKVADITFGYANEELIAALTKRGSMIAHNEFQKVAKEDERISQVLQDKYDQLTRPTAAFIIFEEEEGASQALKASGKCGRDIMGLPVKFLPASEPTDIIWENRHFYPGFNYKIFCCKDDWKESRTCREILGYSFVIVCLSLSFLLILYLASIEAKFVKVFPPQNCDAIKATYGSMLEEYAYYDDIFVTHTENMASSGCLMCFCQEQVELIGMKAATETNYSAPGQEPDTICKTYLKLDTKAFILGESFSYLIVGFNYVLRTITIMVVTWVGYATQTAQLERITTVTFLCQFFNTAFILLLVNADLTEQPITLMFKWGSNGDFNSSFYKTIGNSLVSTMTFNMYYPLLEFLMYWGMRVLFRVLNRGLCTCSKYTTKSTSIKDYQDIYSGPAYYIHYKYSTILNCVFVTFMFGFGLPIFFPIALGSLTILYFMEKSMLYWSYQQPPMYDERLNDSVLSKLKYAPLFFLAFGYWMASSNQLLSNDYLTPVFKKTDTRLTEHVFQDIFSANGWSLPAFPLITMFFLTLICCWLGWAILPCIEKCCPSVRIASIEIDQPIDSYFASVDEEDREWSVKEEENSRQHLDDLKILLNEQYEKMRDTPMTKGSTLQGVHSYDMLANPLYSDAFQYVSAAVPNRADYIIDDDNDEGNDCVQSDLVRAVLNLAYMTEEKAKNFKFNQKSFSQQLAGKLLKAIGKDKDDVVNGDPEA